MKVPAHCLELCKQWINVKFRPFVIKKNIHYHTHLSEQVYSEVMLLALITPNLKKKKWLPDLKKETYLKSHDQDWRKEK